MIAFDALVGNNDRHFYNWGVIDNKKKTHKPLKLAPIYDSARGLLWNFSDDNVIATYNAQLAGSNKVNKYIESACPRISIENNKEANHFDLIKHVKEDNKEYKKIVNELASVENEERVIEMIEKEFYSFFIVERARLTSTIIRSRFKRVREI